MTASSSRVVFVRGKEDEIWRVGGACVALCSGLNELRGREGPGGWFRFLPACFHVSAGVAGKGNTMM